MARVLTIALKDLAEILVNTRAVVLCLVLPGVFLYLVGQLRTQPFTMNVLIAGAGKTGSAERATADGVADILGEIEMFRVTVEEPAPEDVLRRLRDGGFDLLVLNGAVYTASTDPFRLNVLQQVVPRLTAILHASAQATSAEVTTTTEARLAMARGQVDQLVKLTRGWATASDGQPAPAKPPGPQPATAARVQAAPAAAPSAEVFAAARANRDLVVRNLLTDIGGTIERELRARPGAFTLVQAGQRVSELSRTAAGWQFTGPAIQDDERAALNAFAYQAQALTPLLAHDGPRTKPPTVFSPNLMEQATLRIDSGEALAFYPTAGERPRALLPETAALILCVLPFVLACHALVREREERTLDVLLANPRMTTATLVAAKAAAPVAIALVAFLSLLIVMHGAFGLYIKDSGLALGATTLLPAALSAALLGLAVSAWTNSALQATVASAIYLLAQALLGGFLYPVSTAGFGPVRLVASAFPLTFAGSTVRAWVLGAEPSLSAAAAPLFAMTAAYAVLAWVALDARLRRL